MRKFNSYYGLWAGLSALYLLLILIIPPNASTLLRYGLTPTKAKLISVSVALPLIGIWYAAFYGFITFKRYAYMIHKSKDGRALSILARGLMCLALSLPLISLITSIFNYLATTHPHLQPTTVIITNYMSLALFLFAFYFIYIGARELVTIRKMRSKYVQQEQLGTMAFVVVSAFYSYVTLVNPARQFPTEGVPRAAYYLADLPLILTIIIPYIVVWYFGMKAAYYIGLYRQKISGTLYRQALGRLAAGIALVIISSMLVRFLVSITTLVNSLTLKLLLFVLYLLLLLIFVGYMFIASGAKKLRRIEEV